MPKQGKTPKKKSKEKTPQKSGESEYPAMDQEELNRLVQNAIEQSQAQLLNKIGSENIVKYETLKNIILRMAHESGLTQSDKCPHEWNKWPGDFGLPSIRKLEDGTKATRAFATELALLTNKLKSTSTFDAVPD